MVFHIDGDNVHSLSRTSFEAIDIAEANIEEWIIQNPSMLGEELLVVASQYAKFDRTTERPDVLALDPEGKLVVVELKRDRADDTTDLQAIKYASYCSTISAEELQQDYRTFWNERGDHEQLTPEDVGERFAEFLGDEVASTTGDGYAEFALDDRPRILLAAGSFGPEITTPVIWLEREFGMDITCVELEAHRTEGEDVYVSSRRVLPIPEAEEYMAKRREKERQQSRSSTRAERAITVLLEAGIVEEGDIVVFDEGSVPDDTDRRFDPDDDFWRGRITGKTGRSNNVEWLENGAEYSFTKLAQTVLEETTGREFNVNGYPYWRHTEYDMTLTELRKAEVGDIDW